MSELLLINITGPDKPGLTSKITATLAGSKIPVLDIGQAVIHNHFSLGMLVEVPKDLLFCAHTLGIQITFTPMCEYTNTLEIEDGRLCGRVQSRPFQPLGLMLFSI